jgi:hypothetical protein
LHGARLQKQLQPALILSVTFIWSHPWVAVNGLWFMIAFIFPSLTPNISGKNFLGALFIPKMLLETGAPPPPRLFYASYAPDGRHSVRRP